MPLVAVPVKDVLALAWRVQVRELDSRVLGTLEETYPAPQLVQGARVVLDLGDGLQDPREMFQGDLVEKHALLGQYVTRGCLHGESAEVDIRVGER